MAVETTAPAPTQSEETSLERTRSDESFLTPPVDIFEDDQGLVLLADLPGVDLSGLAVNLNRNHLTIQGRARELAHGAPIYREYELTGFFREFEIMDDIDPERITAELKDGVLTLRLPRAPQAAPRRIQVQAS